MGNTYVVPGKPRDQKGQKLEPSLVAPDLAGKPGALESRPGPRAGAEDIQCPELRAESTIRDWSADQSLAAH